MSHPSGETPDYPRSRAKPLKSWGREEFERIAVAELVIEKPGKRPESRKRGKEKRVRKAPGGPPDGDSQERHQQPRLVTGKGGCARYGSEQKHGPEGSRVAIPQEGPEQAGQFGRKQHLGHRYGCQIKSIWIDGEDEGGGPGSGRGIEEAAGRGKQERAGDGESSKRRARFRCRPAS